MYTAMGIRDAFMDAYNVLCVLPDMTDIVDNNSNIFLPMANNTQHDPMMLQEPDCMSAMEVDNTEYEKGHQDRYMINGQTLRVATGRQLIYYQVSMAAMIQLGKWFDYMRENDVYDNTKIILVTDHGSDELFDEDEHRLGDIDCFFPLMVEIK